MTSHFHICLVPACCGAGGDWGVAGDQGGRSDRSGEVIKCVFTLLMSRFYPLWQSKRPSLWTNGVVGKKTWGCLSTTCNEQTDVADSCWELQSWMSCQQWKKVAILPLSTVLKHLYFTYYLVIYILWYFCDGAFFDIKWGFKGKRGWCFFFSFNLWSFMHEYPQTNFGPLNFFKFQSYFNLNNFIPKCLKWEVMFSTRWEKTYI